MKTPGAALVPSAFFDPDHVGASLSEVVTLDGGDQVSYVDVPEYDAKLLYVKTAGEEAPPELYHVLEDLKRCGDYNKIVASWSEGLLSLAVARGRDLLLANVYEAADFTTAEYFIFLALKKLQLNPEVSTISFRTPLSEEERMSLYRYFKSVEQL